ncbi:MAG TPA: L,D-transpeptidase [Acidobacteriaceae bacterium]|jgi:lipoprotein-anchoring transpeptidase ErfK/SrfK|nr:L,D-transpeptidase [Acidobacteriaceae bacterium]
MNGKASAMAAAAGFLVLSTTALLGQAKMSAVSDTIAPMAQAVTRTIIVSLEDRRLALLEDGVVVKVYPVAVGKEATPSPTGTFTIVARVTNPTYYHSGKVIPAGPGNPVGTRWMGLSDKGYGIHGTNEPRSIGKAASHGCIRMGRRDLENLFAQVRAGDAVEIVGERDAETAAIFGTPAGPATPAVTAVLAKAEPQAADAAASVEAPAAPADK